MELEALIVQLVITLANTSIAIAMFLNLREIRKDRKHEFLKKPENFYLPFINLFSHKGLRRDFRGPRQGRGDHCLEEVVVRE